jgi:hypothetical protein
VNWLARLLLGNGTLKPKLRAELEAEGLVLLEEGLVGSIRYDHFKAPGRRFNGKVTGVCVGLGISEERLVVYSHSGRAELIDSPFSSQRLSSLGIAADNDRLILEVDYDRLDAPNASGQVTIRARTPKAQSIAEQLRTRLRV